LKSPLSVKKKNEKLRTKRHSYGKTHFPKKKEKNKMKKKTDIKRPFVLRIFAATSSSSFFGKWEIF
jgi:hypothetical protein